MATQIGHPTNGKKIEGLIKIENQELGRRDAIGIPTTKELQITALEKSKVLLLDVPMNLEANA